MAETEGMLTCMSCKKLVPSSTAVWLHMPIIRAIYPFCPECAAQGEYRGLKRYGP